ncbi:MAG: polysaccharide biosynthesis/export family protein [Candidatus Azobacteroides sp.]|nr:polysaccharide biosynthesis/export family protein [Candidatus Azobacteroides sp.]
MKSKRGIYYSFFFLLSVLASCGTSSRKVVYFQSKEDRQGQIVNLPSYRIENTVRFRPDDILGITVNVPGEQSVASDYNLPLVPAATSENSTEDFVSQGMGRQAFLISKDGTIDFPVLGIIKVAGYTQGELEKYLKERLSTKLVVPAIVTVRLMNFKITVTGEVGRPGTITVDKDNINILEALALAGDMSIYGKRDDIRLFRQKPDGGYTEVSLDISKEDIISSPYFFLQQNDALYVKPVNTRTQNADVSPHWNILVGIGAFVMSVATFVIMLAKD